MSLADDQFIDYDKRESALDELSKRVSRHRDPMKAANEVARFEADIEKAKTANSSKANENGKTITNPGKLLEEIQNDMRR